MSTDNIILSAKGISVIRDSRYLVKNADLSLRAGKITTLIGPNGAGKTTLVRCVLGLIKNDEGTIIRAAGLRIGYMPQKLHIEPSLPLTVSRFLSLGGKPLASLPETLALTGIQHLLDQPMQQLSGGETQRVLLARALLRAPQLLVLDEPVQGVDVTGQAALYGLINDIRKQKNCGVLLVSHDLHLVMANTDTVVCLNQHVCCHGHPEKITNDPAYLALFGQSLQPQVAFYTHHHDHQHDAHGDVVTPESHTSCDHNHA